MYLGTEGGFGGTTLLDSLITIPLVGLCGGLCDGIDPRLAVSEGSLNDYIQIKPTRTTS